MPTVYKAPASRKGSEMDFNFKAKVAYDLIYFNLFLLSQYLATRVHS